MLPLKDVNPSRKRPFLTYTIVAINILVFFIELAQGVGANLFFMKYGFIPYRFNLFFEGTLRGNVYSTFIDFYVPPWKLGTHYWKHVVFNYFWR